MPLITSAYLAGAAGLLLGLGGALRLAGAVVVVGAASAFLRRSAAAASLTLLLAALALLGGLLHHDDTACARAIATRGGAVVRLSESLRPGRSARGEVAGRRCRLRVRIATRAARFDAGALVRVRGVARRSGSFVSFSDAAVSELEPPGRLARWRTRAGRSIDALYGAQAPIARALLIADERDIAPDVRRAFADAGIIHMLSVSGLHVAVLAEAVALALLLAGAGVRRAELVAVGVTVLFVLFVGAPAPAVRAATMYGAVVASRLLQRPTSPWAFLALGAMLPLANPRVVLDIGYQLSVAGMAGLIACGILWRRIPPPNAPPWAWRAGREVVATVIASAVTGPIVAWHFGRMSLAAPLTNLAAAPLLALGQPALFLSLLVAPLRPLSQFIADGTSLILWGIHRVAALGAAIPWSAIDVMPSAVTAGLLSAAAAALLMACVSRAWMRAALVGGTAVMAALWWPIVAPGSSHLELHMIDVGQGDAVAVRTPAARWIVVDAGEAWPRGDAGARLVAPYLRRRGGDVAALVVTHPHADHIGGAASLLRLLRVASLYDGAFVAPSAVYDSMLATARARRVTWRMARAGDSLVIDGVHLAVLAPDADGLAEATGPNDASVVLVVRYRGVSILLTGDAERGVESRLVRRYGDALRADVLKVGHHGSATSSTDDFLDVVRPRVALVSVGSGNRYGHPSPRVLQALASRGASVLRTDHDGTVVVSTDGRLLHVRTEDASWDVTLSARRR